MSEEKKKKSIWGIVIEVIKVVATLLAGYVGGNAIM